jgi:hypothetical protein
MEMPNAIINIMMSIKNPVEKITYGFGVEGRGESLLEDGGLDGQTGNAGGVTHDNDL